MDHAGSTDLRSVPVLSGGILQQGRTTVETEQPMSQDALFQDVIRKRRSVRKFEPGRSISRDVLQRVVDCGRWAPSGPNVQCWDFIVVDDPTMRDKVMDVFLRQAQ
jgi:Nitroreductase family